MDKIYKIYGLKVIGSDDIRYIGYTKRELKARFKSHLNDAKANLTYKKCYWIRKHNYNIEIILIEDNLNYKQALEREIYWIKQYPNLLNMTEGGDKNPMENLEVRLKHKNIMKSIPKEKTIHIGSDNWMTTKEGKEWLSKESKKRWKAGIYKPQPNKNIEYDILYKLYIIEEKTLKECAIELNTTYRSIVRNLGRLDIKKYKKNNE